MAFVRTHTRFWDAIEAAMRREHGLTMARSPSGLSKLLDRMDASGLIRRDPDPDDARAAFATITPRGTALVAAARASHHDLLRRTFGAALSDRDLADLSRVMGRVGESIDPKAST